MVKGLYTAYTGMLNEQNRMDVMTNNLANVSTTGYKKQGATSMSFDAVLAYKIKDTTQNPDNAVYLGRMTPGVRIGEGYTDYSEGSFRQTGNVLDLALAGAGFFEIEYTNRDGETKTQYTRNGELTLDLEGYLVTKDGSYVMGDNGRIQLDTNLPISIDRNGNITQDGVDKGQIKLVDFEDYNYLEHVVENLYNPVDGATQTASTATIRSGYLEMSNVSAVTEMVNMITITRQYEANQKIIQTIDSSLEKAVNQIGKV